MNTLFFRGEKGLSLAWYSGLLLCLVHSTSLVAQPGQRPDPGDVILYGSPGFEVGPAEETKEPGSAAIYDAKFPDVHEPGQKIWNQIPAKNNEIHIQLEREKTPNPIALRVLGPVNGFRLAPEGRPLPGDLEALVGTIVNGQMSDSERAMAVFRFVDENFGQWWFPAEGYRTIRLHSEAVSRQIWGYGYGFCSDVARVAAVLWRMAGLPSRIVGIDPYHTVVEVYYDKAWHLFDIQHRSFWRDRKGDIASAEMLRQQPLLFSQGLDKHGLDPIGYPPIPLAYWYGNATISYHDEIRWETTTDLGLHLRDGEYFELNFVGKPTIYHPDFWVQAYGASTLDRDPPWPVSGRICYAPGRYGAQPEWQTMQTNDGRTAYVITMQSPYLFTEGYLRLPAVAEKGEVFVYAHERYKYAGPLKANGARLGRQIAGTYRFAVCLVMDEPLQNPPETLADLEMVALVQVSHIGVPRLRPGSNTWPVGWDSGQPELKLWYRPSGPDLSVSYLPAENLAKVGDTTVLRYRVQNDGSGPAMPTTAVLYNTTTGLFSEDVELVGTYTVPPLDPGESFVLECHWIANTRQTWYGQNPYLQQFELHLDPEKLRSDHDRSNHRLSHRIQLRDQDGNLRELPGYTRYPMKNGAAKAKRFRPWINRSLQQNQQ